MRPPDRRPCCDGAPCDGAGRAEGAAQPKAEAVPKDDKAGQAAPYSAAHSDPFRAADAICRLAGEADERFATRARGSVRDNFQRVLGLSLSAA